MKKFFRNRINEITEKFKDKKVLISSSSANFFGQESLRKNQIGGNGVLILTEKDLIFEMWIPKKKLIIPLNSIIKIITPKSHLGKIKFRSLLKVIFKNEKNESDSVA